LAAPLLPELAPDDEPAGRSGGGGDVIEGEVGETLALFSLPGPTLPGFAVTPGAPGSFVGGFDSSAKAGPTANNVIAAIAMQTGFIEWLLFAKPLVGNAPAQWAVPGIANLICNCRPN
jgi:hypothetical protein